MRHQRDDQPCPPPPCRSHLFGAASAARRSRPPNPPTAPKRWRVGRLDRVDHLFGRALAQPQRPAIHCAAAAAASLWCRSCAAAAAAAPGTWCALTQPSKHLVTARRAKRRAMCAACVSATLRMPNTCLAYSCSRDVSTGIAAASHLAHAGVQKLELHLHPCTAVFTVVFSSQLCSQLQQGLSIGIAVVGHG